MGTRRAFSNRPGCDEPQSRFARLPSAMTAIDATPEPHAPEPAISVAQNLAALARTQKDKVSVKDIVETVEQGHGLAPVVFVLTLPVLLPMPPGVSMVLALPLLVVAPQMMLLRKDLWIPQRLERQ